MNVLIKVDWALWGALAIMAAYALLRMAAVILAWPLVALIADSAIKARRAARYESPTSSPR